MHCIKVRGTSGFTRGRPIVNPLKLRLVPDKDCDSLLVRQLFLSQGAQIGKQLLSSQQDLRIKSFLWTDRETQTRLKWAIAKRN